MGSRLKAIRRRKHPRTPDGYTRRADGVLIPPPEELGPTPERPEGYINWYTCRKCGSIATTRDVDNGTTPAMIQCLTPDAEGNACGGQSWSAFYPKGPRPDGVPPVLWEWYRPGYAETKRLDAFTRQHVMDGGLLLRRIEEV